MAIESAGQLLELVRRSELVEPGKLDGYIRDLRAQKTVPPNAQQMAQLLVRDAIITRFQAEQLLNGKWNGFRLGKYTIYEHLGSGGMGAVYLAEHRHMKRAVALKVLPQEKSKDKGALARFYREAKAVAAVDHPNIIRAHDIDQEGSIHFMVMEYVDGTSLNELVKLHGPFSVQRAAHYISQAAQALQHVHEIGLIHRDIKPGNLLLDRSGTIKVLDLGLARFFNDRRDNLTRINEETVIGTADYISPEQAVDSHTVDIRADIYSLGCTFYFMLSGRSPYHDATAVQKIMWHQMKPPKPIRELRPEVPQQIADIIAKMMHKEPGQRYQTPQEIADALRSWTRKPIPAPREDEMPHLSPAVKQCLNTSVSRSRNTRVGATAGPGLFGRGLDGVRFVGRACRGTARFLWRNYTPKRAAAALVLLACLSGGLYFYIGSLANPSDPGKGGSNGVKVSGKLDRYGDPLPVDARARLGTQRFRAPNNPNFSSLSPDGTLLAAAFNSKELIVWNIESGKELHKVEGNNGDFQLFAFSADGKTLAAADSENTVSFWDLSSGKRLRRLRGHQGRIQTLAFAPTGNILATGGSDNSVRIWDPNNDATLHVLTGHQQPLYRVAFSPDGQALASTSQDRSLRVWNVSDGKQRFAIEAGRTSPQFVIVAFSGDGKQVLAPAPDGVHRWEAGAGAALPTLAAGMPPQVNGLTAATSKPLMATWQNNQPLRLWDTNTGQVLFQLEESLNRYPAAYSFTADGAKLIFVDGNLSITIWSTQSGKRLYQFDGHGKTIRQLAFSSDSKQLASYGLDNMIRFWNTASGEELYRPLNMGVNANSPFGFVDDNKGIVTWNFIGLNVYDPSSPTPKQTRLVKTPAPLQNSPLGVLFADGQKALLARTNQPQQVLGLIDLKTSALLHQFPDAKPNSGLMAVSANGQFAAVSCVDGIRVWNLADGFKPLKTIAGDSIFLLSFSPDGKTLAAADNRYIHLWNVEAGQKVGQLDTTGISIGTLGFAGDGSHVIGGDDSGYLFVWQVGKEKHVHSRRAHTEAITVLAVSPDGKTLATGSNDTTILLWELDKVLSAR